MNTTFMVVSTDLHSGDSDNGIINTEVCSIAYARRHISRRKIIKTYP